MSANCKGTALPGLKHRDAQLAKGAPLQRNVAEEAPLQTAAVDRRVKAEYLAAPMRARMQAS
jgi:hypothetical protein